MSSSPCAMIRVTMQAFNSLWYLVALNKVLLFVFLYEPVWSVRPEKIDFAEKNEVCASLVEAWSPCCCENCVRASYSSTNTLVVEASLVEVFISVVRSAEGGACWWWRVDTRQFLFNRVERIIFYIARVLIIRLRTWCWSLLKSDWSSSVFGEPLDCQPTNRRENPVLTN